MKIRTNLWLGSLFIISIFGFFVLIELSRPALQDEDLFKSVWGTCDNPDFIDTKTLEIYKELFSEEEIAELKKDELEVREEVCKELDKAWEVKLKELKKETWKKGGHAVQSYL